MALKIVALAGGVGGAKLVDGLAASMPAEDLIVIVNTGDDFNHLGLRICPDLDTVLYTLAGLADPVRGWGRADESWRFLETLETLGGPTWFRLGDRDLALHAERSRRLHEGETLTAITRQLCDVLGVKVRLLPMTDQVVETLVLTDDGTLAFQEYFVAQRSEPAVRGFRFQGMEEAAAAPGVLRAIGEAGAIILCPSNPWVSLDPILAVPGVRQAVSAKVGIGISPLMGRKAVKGPAAKMAAELGVEPTAFGIAQRFREVLSGWMIDNQDEQQAGKIRELGIEVRVTNILMKDREDRKRLGSEALQFARDLIDQEATT